MGIIIDMTGQKVERWTVREYAFTKNKKAYWWCDCDCGTKNVAVSGVSLRYGDTKSCGCIQKEKALEVGRLNRKYNTYDLSGKYGIGYASNTNKEFYFDLEDYDLIKDYTWHEDAYGYLFSDINHKRCAMHRIIMLKENHYDLSIKIDHIHGRESRNDNRKLNLRQATSQENNRNKTYISSATSGFIGVSFRKDRNKWRAYIAINRQQINLGVYEDYTDAVRARLNAEIKYFSEFAYESHKKILDYINNGGILEPYNRKQIENIMNEKE